VQRGGTFSPVSVCGCLFVNVVTLEPYKRSSWNFYGSKIWSDTRTSSKMVAIRCTVVRRTRMGGDLAAIMF